MARLSVVMITRNEAHNLDRSLGSAAWADEIVVLDSFSTDGTVDRARAWTPAVHQHAYDGYSRQLERAVALAHGDWVFVLDADEVVSAELAEQIRAVVAGWTGAPDQPAGYRVPRRMWAFGRRIEHGGWSPDRQLRLFRRDRGRPLHREVHGAYTCDGPIGSLEGGLDHHTYDHVHACVARMNDYTSLEVSNRLDRDPDVRPSPARMLLSPVSAFLRSYVRKAGWRDGPAGLWLALLTAQYALLGHMKLWEHRLRESEPGDRRPPIRATEVAAARERA